MTQPTEETTQRPTIDSKFAAMIPPLLADEREGLEASLVRDGCLEPLAIWAGRGVLLDGHNRLEICERLGIAYRTVGVDIADRAAAKQWIVEHQLARRNLTTSQRVTLALKAKPMIAEKAKENERAGGRMSQQGSQLVVNPVNTTTEIANIAGVSPETVRRYEYVQKNASPDLLTKMGLDEVSIRSAYMETKNKAMGAASRKTRKENVVKDVAVVASDGLAAARAVQGRLEDSSIRVSEIVDKLSDGSTPSQIRTALSAICSECVTIDRDANKSMMALKAVMSKRRQA